MYWSEQFVSSVHVVELFEGSKIDFSLKAREVNHIPYEENQMVMETIEKLCPPGCVLTCVLTCAHGMEEVREENPGNSLFKWIDSPFTLQELQGVLACAKTKSSPGWDRIDYKLLKFLPRELKELLLAVLNLFLKSVSPVLGHTP